MAFIQAQVTKVDNGYIVGLVERDILSKEVSQSQFIAEDLDKVLEILGEAGK